MKNTLTYICGILVVIVISLFSPLHAQTQPTEDPSTDNLSNYQSQIIAARDELTELTRIREKIQEAISIGKFIQRLDNLEALSFPVVLGDTISGVPIYVVFDNLRLYPEYAQLAVNVMVELPQREMEGSQTEYTTLLFGSPAIKFSRDGGIIGETKIALLADYPIRTKNPEKTAFILKRTKTGAPPAPNNEGPPGGTYVKIDCDGFVELGVEADVIFSQDWMLPVDRAGEPLTNGRVRSTASAVVNDWNNMLFEVDLPNFTLRKFPKLNFNLRQAVFDFSDFRNSPNMRMPPGYAERYLPPGNKSLWRGVYIRELTVTLPKEFNDCTAANAPPGGPGNGTGMLMLDQTGEYAYDDWETTVSDRGRGPNPPELILAQRAENDPAPLPPHPAPAAAPNRSSAPPDAALALTATLPEPAPFPVHAPQSAEGCRVQVGVQDLLIDFGVGVSGSFRGTNVLNSGSMDGWPFTVERLRLDVMANRIQGFGFGGQVQISLNKEDEAFDYDAYLNPPNGEYNFSIATTKSYKFEVFKLAEVGIDSSSYLDVQLDDGRFTAAAILTGYAAVKAKLGSKGDDSAVPADKQTFKANRLEFEGLYVSTDLSRPIGLVEGGSVGFANSPTLLGYPLPISDPKLVETDGGVQIRVSARLNLAKDTDNGFAAGTDVDLKGKAKMEKANDRPDAPETSRWKSDGIGVSDIFVRIKTPGLAINGRARVFEEDPVYGRGFQGSLNVAVGPDAEEPLVVVDLNAMFGQTDFKYWYVDGYVELDKVGIPLIPGVLEANGFGGGAYYHMRMASADVLGGGDGSLGTMSSGVKYEPDEAITLGLKATLGFRSPPPTETLDGVATLELAFAGTGLQDVMFYGRIEVVSPKANSWMKKKGEGMAKQVKRLNLPTEEARRKNDQAIAGQRDAILGSVFLRMNFSEGFEFQGTFKARVSAAEGKIEGGGDIDILISEPQDRWHIYVGGYTDGSIVANDGTNIYPVRVRVRLGDGIEGSAGAYFLMGNDIPGPPPIDPEVAAWFDEGTAQNDRGGNLNAQAARGKGFAFGAYAKAKLDVKLKEGGDRLERRNWLKGQLGAGFDISLLHYANNTRCSRDSRKSPHGHKGWRATGRLWAYAAVYGRSLGKDFDLSLGIKVDGDLPNPTYMSMRIKVGIRIIFKVKFNVRVKIGKECGRPVYATLDPALEDIHYATLPPLARPVPAFGFQPALGAN